MVILCITADAHAAAPDLLTVFPADGLRSLTDAILYAHACCQDLARGGDRAHFQGVLKPKLDRIHSDSFGQNIHLGIHGPHHLGNSQTPERPPQPACSYRRR